jgi:hypothetical protein
MTGKRILTLIFRDGPLALAIALTNERVLVTAFEHGRKRTLGTQKVPYGLIQYVGTPRRDIRLEWYIVNDDRVLMLFDAHRSFGYAINLAAPHFSEWGEAPEEIADSGIPAAIIEGVVMPSGEVDAGLS